MFALRGVDAKDMIARAGAKLATPKRSGSRGKALAEGDLAALFGLDMAAEDTSEPHPGAGAGAATGTAAGAGAAKSPKRAARSSATKSPVKNPAHGRTARRRASRVKVKLSR